MFDSESSGLDSVPFRVTNPKRIPSQRYYDEAFFKLECEKLWPHMWQMACRLEEIPQIGDWTEYKILDKSVIIVRTQSGVKAFHNACRHRGVRLAKGAGNCADNGFICPFHGWRWNMDGENTFVYGRNKFSEEELDQADIALAPCRVELWGGCAFINFDDEAAPLLEFIGPAAKRMDGRNADKLKVDWWRASVLPVNWKLAMEAFMEGYHVMATHPQLHAVTAAESRAYGADSHLVAPRPPTASGRDYVEVAVDHLANLSEGMGGMIHPREVEIAETLRKMDVPEAVGPAAMAFYAKLREEITKQGRAQGMPIPDLVELAKQPFYAVEYFFPHYFLLPMFASMASYRVRPLTAETCLFEIWSLSIYPDSDERDTPVMPELSSHDDPSYPAIPRQDYSNLPLQQLGLHAGGFEFMRLSPQIEGMISNYQRLIDGYIAGLEPEKLAKASAIVCMGFDSPIMDLGF